jgi:Asp-tRNA(Asn)/Glu-tRNA(Gln) amidotransferase A subunit family amidase
LAHVALTDLTATEAAARIARGDLSSEELVTACLDRIAELESKVEAWAFLDREHALAQARAADETRREGKGTGRLHGVPVGIKDNIDTSDMPTENGSPLFKGRLPFENAACVSALRSAGAIVLGKTATTELAVFTPTKTRNPRNLEHTPGGSSSGSAAAVAAGMVPAALGTQTLGSVIRPASYCGVYGFKPTFGLIPRPGVLTQAPSLDTVGVFAKSIEDVALLTDVLQVFDARDPASVRTSRGWLFDTATEDWPLPPLFVFVKTHAWTQAEPATHEAFGELKEHLKGQVHEISLDATTERSFAAAVLIQKVELAVHYGPLLDRSADMISKDLAHLIEEGRRVRAADYYAALNARESLYSVLEELFTDYGPILTPAATGPAPKGLGSTGSPVFCGAWTYLGVPTVSLPLLEAEGLPIGVQLVGPRRDDGRLLRSARWLVKTLERDGAAQRRKTARRPRTGTRR